MNKGTERNILTQLGITSDQFGMVTVLYTVSYRSHLCQLSLYPKADQSNIGALYCGRNSLQSTVEKV